MEKLIWIHGANASPMSFTFLKQKFKNHKSLFLSYDTNEGLDKVIESLRQQIVDEGFQDATVISHSLGGVIALLLHSKIIPFKRIITISSPFGGSKSASLLKWWTPNYHLYKDISHDSPFIQELEEFDCKIPVFSFVSEFNGSPLFNEPNDGVVTVASQTCLKYPNYIKINLNHFEALLSDEISLKIGEIIKDQNTNF